MQPRISIIVPVYKAERYIRRCLDSIQAQTMTDWECILVDDGSPDRSGDICDEYAQKDTRFKLIHKENEGVTKARIDGFSRSKGDYIVFVDADDYLSDLFLEKMINAMNLNNVDFVSCQHNDIINEIASPVARSIIGLYEGEALRKMISTNLFYDKKYKMGGMPLMLWAKLFKRDVLNESLNEGIGFWYAEDQVTLLDIFYKAKAIYSLPDYLYNYVHYENQVTSQYRKDYWDAYYKLWNKLIKIDKEHLLNYQLPHRMWNYSVDFYFKSLPYISTYEEYKKLTKHIFESNLLRQYVFKKSIDDLPRSKFERLFYYLLKYKLYLLLYIEIRRIKKNM